MDIEGIIKQVTGKSVINFDNYVDLWESWYEGDVKAFHHYKVYNGRKDITCTRKTLNMAKKVSEDWANLLLNEKTDVTISESYQQELERLLNDVKFWTKGNEGIEKTFALGNGAFVEGFDNNKKPRLQFVNRQKIYPITIEDDKVTECAFVNVNSNSIRVQIHALDNNGNYYIRTLIGDNKNNDYTMYFGDVDRDFTINTGSNRPWFQMYKPNIANNIDMNSPMGISIFANAIDVLQGVDLAYDGFCNEVRLGKSRIFVDKRITVYVDGIEKPVFDNNDDGFYFMGDGQEQNGKPLEVYSPTLRTESYFNGINNALNLLSSKVGFGANHYRFDQNGISTATQVISENSEMFRSLKKHEIVLNDVIIEVCRALMYICNEFCEGYAKFNVDEYMEVKFDDSIIEDKESQKASDRQDVNMGVMSKAEYRAKWHNEDEQTAQQKIDEIQEQNQANMSNFFSTGE